MIVCETLWLLTSWYKCSAIAEMGDHLSTTDMGRKLGGCVPYGEVASPCNTMWPGLRPTFVPSGILVDPAVWPQQTWAENWGFCPLEGVELGPRQTQCCLGRDLPLYQVASWSIQLFDHNKHGQKVWGCAPFRGAGSPSSTMWPGPRPTAIPSGILP